MSGHVRQRGAKGQWYAVFDVVDPVTRKRKRRWQTLPNCKGKREAEKACERLIAERDDGSYINPSKMTVSEFLDRWERDWVANNLSPKTGERYGELLRKHVRLRRVSTGGGTSSLLGDIPIQKVDGLLLLNLYGGLLQDGHSEGRGLVARTVGHVHRALHRAFGHAVTWKVIKQNVVKDVKPPRVESTEIRTLSADEVQRVLRKLDGLAIHPIASLALATGMRRGELCALRWRDVDLDRGFLRVERSLEQTRKGLRFKSPKTRLGRRTISLPASAVTLLRSHWKAQQEQRLALGLGKAPVESLVFARWDGEPRHPDALTKEWSVAMAAAGLADVTLHSLRHTHASHLIASGLDVLTISRRLGHSSPTITLGVYGHLFENSDDRAAEIMEATFAAAKNGEMVAD